MNDNKKIAVNSILLFIRLVITSGIGLIISRLVLDALGASNFGLYNIVGGIVVLINVINTAMVSTTYRFLAFEIGKNEKGNLNKIFNISTVIHFFLALFILLIGETVGLYYIHNYLNITSGNLNDAIFVFHFSILTAAITTMTIPFQGLVTAVEKFNVRVSIEIFSSILNLFLILLLVRYDGNKLRAYAVLMFFINVVRSLLFLLYGRYKYSKITKLKIYKDWAKFKEMLSFTGWVALGAFTSLCKSSGGAIIVNYFFGTILNAAYAVANSMNVFVMLFSQNLSGAAIPQITKSYSGGDTNRSVNLVANISKFSFFLMLLAALPLLLQTVFILDIWLIDIPEYSAIFTRLMILDALILCLGAGIPAMIQATGKIKYFQISSFLISIITLPLAFLFYKWESPPYVILILFTISSLIARIVSFYILYRLMSFNVLKFLKISTLPIGYVILSLIPIIIVNYYINKSVGIIAYLFLSEIFLVLSIYYLGITKSERELVNSKILFLKSKLWKR